MKFIRLKLSELELNTGQIEGLPKNPRFIRDEKFKKLVKSVKDDPEMMDARPIMVFPRKKKYVIIGGNMRYRAVRELQWEDVPCVIIPEATTVETLKAYTIKDNVSGGEWSWDYLANEWDEISLKDFGLDIPIDFNIQDDNIEEPKMTLKEGKEEEIKCPKCGFVWRK